MVTLRKTAEEQLRVLFAEQASPPLEVIIPILETAKCGERELAAQEYETSTGLAKGIIRILGLKDTVNLFVTASLDSEFGNCPFQQ